MDLQVPKGKFDLFVVIEIRQDSWKLLNSFESPARHDLYQAFFFFFF